MSTKSIIKSHDDHATGTGFHLFVDQIEQALGQDLIHLELEGMSFSVSGGNNGSGIVEVAIPRAMAEKLGLVPPAPARSGVGVPG